MEAQTQSMNDAAQGSAPQPQRDRRQNRSRNKAGYYKTDPVPTEETQPLQHQGSKDSNQDSQDKAQRQNQGGQRQGNIRERTFQSRAQTTQNGESNGTASQSPKENGRPKNRRQKQNNPREDAGTKKGYQKKNQDASENEKQENYNERFDNTDAMEKGQPAVRNPHMAHQIAEAARIQQVLPEMSKEVSKEVRDKIQKIRDIVLLPDTPEQNLEVYTVLEENHFDEEKAISSLLETNGKPVHDNNVARPKWASVVKKGTKRDSSVTEPQRNRPQQQRSGSPKFPINSQMPSPVMEAFVSSGMMDPEMVVQSLTLAIQHQLQVIQEQTKMLTMMQNELTVITQSGTSERQQLLQEEEELRQRKIQLEEELQRVHIRMEQVEQALEENKKKKADKINNITQHHMALLKKNPGLAQLPAPPTSVHQDQVQQRPIAPRQQEQRRYNQ